MNTFCIPIRAENEEDLYDRFNPSGLAFSGELKAYLEDYLADRRAGEGLSLELRAAQAPDLERFRTTWQMFIEKLIDRNKRKTRRENWRAFFSLLLGLVLIVLGYTTSGHLDVVTQEILSAVGSFSLWAAIASFLETIPTLRFNKKLLKKFSHVEIRFQQL